MSKIFLEIIATSLEDCNEIATNKVDRIELCESMNEGGLTPNYDLIRLVTTRTKIPIRVMVRNTSRDFIYNNQELQQMQEDIKFIKSTPAEGIVLGMLTASNDIDYESLKILLDVAKPLKVTFHRAFDFVNDKISAAKKLIEMGIDTILTSGGVLSIDNNFLMLQKLNQLPIEILVGGGINYHNCIKLYNLGLNHIHCGRIIRKDNLWNNEIDSNLIKKFLNFNKENYFD